ncbi:hypothetical protein [Alkaliphilus peptidifermentans]|uniref:Uncharacterized protein n=1 Tax=Alkaliphilus peptidifermentans DSM 18978 TaxID=1120976 RepID=A0A1G5FJZ6_9FIRM|nr:hypothetical protein [Alkaliphilus peptidifermentans]SCY39589.1 hypothetical protein SAMN03080606_01445 [Alkaliphilus peptidifermentans DSM 18978]
MPWKQGKIKLADGTTYPAELLIEKGKEVWNVKIQSDRGVVEEIDPDHFANKLKKSPEDVYPFTYELDN